MNELCELKLSPNNILKQLKLIEFNKASLGLPKFLQSALNKFDPFQSLYADYLKCLRIPWLFDIRQCNE